MRFSLATLALLAGAAVAQMTVTTVDVETITSCAPTVTDCPARSSSTPAVVGMSTTSVAPVSETSPAAGVSTVSPAVSSKSSVAPYPMSSSPAGVSTSVIAVTTCVPTTILSTITFTPSTSVPVGTGSPSVVGTGGVVPSGTSTGTSPAYTGAANAVSGSFVMVGAAAVAAVFLA